MPAFRIEKRRKPRPHQQPAATTAHAKKESSLSRHSNLKLHEWFTVFAYIDEHPTLSQLDIVKHFATLKSGALLFTQSTLSRKLRERSELERRAHDNPSALNSKRPRVVTRPDIERALVLWVEQMEAKQEPFNGPMIKEKRRRFEELLNVPEEERLLGDGWLSSFCRTYKIRELCHYGEAASVDLAAVQAADEFAIAAMNETGHEIPLPAPSQLAALETTIAESCTQNRALGAPPMLLESVEEAENLDSLRDGDSDRAIVEKLTKEMNGEADDIDADDDAPALAPDISRTEAINLCERLTEACLRHLDANSDLAVGLLAHLRQFRSHLHRDQFVQSTLDEFFTPNPSV